MSAAAKNPQFRAPVIQVRWIAKRSALFNDLLMYYYGIYGHFPVDVYEIREWLASPVRLPKTLGFFRHLQDRLIAKYFNIWKKAMEAAQQEVESNGK